MDLQAIGASKKCMLKPSDKIVCCTKQVGRAVVSIWVYWSVYQTGRIQRMIASTADGWSKKSVA
jgi:hypothetical protein